MKGYQPNKAYMYGQFVEGYSLCGSYLHFLRQGADLLQRELPSAEIGVGILVTPAFLAVWVADEIPGDDTATVSLVIERRDAPDLQVSSRFDFYDKATAQLILRSRFLNVVPCREGESNPGMGARVHLSGGSDLIPGVPSRFLQHSPPLFADVDPDQFPGDWAEFRTPFELASPTGARYNLGSPQSILSKVPGGAKHLKSLDGSQIYAARWEDEVPGGRIVRTVAAVP